MTLRLLPLTTRESERSKNGEAAQSPHDIFFAAVQEAKNNTPSKSQVHTRERERERKSLAIPGALSPSESDAFAGCRDVCDERASAAGVQAGQQELVAERRVLIN
jgi:hypothetical protein